MKFICAILALAFSTSTLTTHQSKWIPMKHYRANDQHKNIFNAINAWALAEYKADVRKHDFEYAIKKTDTGFKTEVTPLYIDKNGKYGYAVDGEMCIDLDLELHIIQTYQCAFPPYPDLSIEKKPKVK